MKFRIFILTLIAALCFSVPAFAQNFDEYKWHDKLSRGVVNLVSSPIEVVRGIDLTSKSTTVANGWTIGLVKGLAGTVLRFGTGLVDVVTFPFSWPDEYKEPLMNPKFVWQDWYGTYLE